MPSSRRQRGAAYWRLIYLDYLIDVVDRKSKLEVDRMCAFDEHRHGAELRCILELCTCRYGERPEAIDVFVAALQRFL